MINKRTTPFPRLLAAILKASFFVLFVAAAHADEMVTLTLTEPYPSGYTFYDYTSTTGSARSEPVSPYPVTLTGVSGLYDNTPALALCFDINNGTPVQTQVSGQFLDETNPAIDPSYYQTYLEATYLINQLDLAGNMAAPISERGPISLAIWEIMWDTSSKSNGQPINPDPAAGPYISAAVQAVTTGAWTAADSSPYLIFVPDNSNYQRFGVIVETPEPGGLMLLGTGLVAMGALLRRRRAPGAPR